MTSTTDIEKKSLEAHVELCAQRYKFLEDQLVTVEEQLSKNSTMIGDLRGGLLLDLRTALLGDDGLPVPGKPVELLQQTLFNAFGPSGLNILLDTNLDKTISLGETRVDAEHDGTVRFRSVKYGGAP